ncbi:hypothetical protein LDENG_00206390 [Lucifuga dentata]|nr:hypothetical protein LDENG_00206390 [Lucifuga dentata]
MQLARPQTFNLSHSPSLFFSPSLSLSLSISVNTSFPLTIYFLPDENFADGLWSGLLVVKVVGSVGGLKRRRLLLPLLLSALLCEEEKNRLFFLATLLPFFVSSHCVLPCGEMCCACVLGSEVQTDVQWVCFPFLGCDGRMVILRKGVMETGQEETKEFRLH